MCRWHHYICFQHNHIYEFPFINQTTLQYSLRKILRLEPTLRILSREYSYTEFVLNDKWWVFYRVKWLLGIYLIVLFIIKDEVTQTMIEILVPYIITNMHQLHIRERSFQWNLVEMNVTKLIMTLNEMFMQLHTRLCSKLIRYYWKSFGEDFKLFLCSEWLVAPKI